MAFFTGGSIGAVSYSIPNFRLADEAKVGGEDTHGNYRWLDIAELCAANLNRIPDQHHRFVGGMEDRQGDGKTITGKQAKYLGRLFYQYVIGKHGHHDD